MKLHSGQQNVSYIYIIFDDKIIVWPRAMMLSSRNNLNAENTFVDLTE